MVVFVVEYFKRFYIVQGQNRMYSNYDLKKMIRNLPFYKYRFDAIHKARRLCHVFKTRKVSLR